MAWTYGESPGTDTDSGRRDAVRLLIGDTDTNDQQLQDAEVDFALSQANNAVYSAAAIAARAIAGKYGRLVDTSFDSVKTSYSQRRDQYLVLAQNLEKQAKKYGSLGVPVAGGISISDMDSVEEDDDRPKPAFRRGQFRERGFGPNQDPDWDYDGS